MQKLNFPGSPNASFITFVILEELLRSLVSSGSLTNDGVRATLKKVIEALSQDGNAMAKPSAEFIRDELLPRFPE